MMKKYLLSLFFLVVFLVGLVVVPYVTTPAAAQATSCWITKIGSPDGPSPTYPPECLTYSSFTGITMPPNLTNCFNAPPEVSGGIAGQYCEMPPSLDGAYKLFGTKWGSKEMIGVLYTVAQQWKIYTHGAGHLKIGDITNSGGHKDHYFGVSVDLTATTNNRDCVANKMRGSGNGSCTTIFRADATIALGKMFVDTAHLNYMLFNGDTGGVSKGIYEYARSKYPRFTQQYRAVLPAFGHDNHFHVYIDRDEANLGKPGGTCTIFKKSKLINCYKVQAATGHPNLCTYRNIASTCN
jgi:hypothetical protein